MKKTKLEQVFEWLVKGELSFQDLMLAYVTYLKKYKEENETLITELAFIATMYREPKSNAGSKKQLENRFKEAIVKSKIFKGTKFEKEL